MKYITCFCFVFPNNFLCWFYHSLLNSVVIDYVCSLLLHRRSRPQDGGVLYDAMCITCLSCDLPAAAIGGRADAGCAVNSRLTSIINCCTFAHLPVVAVGILYYPSDQSIVGNIVYRP